MSARHLEPIFPFHTAVLCPSLSAPANGQVVVSSRSPGSQASYSCNTGFVLQGATTRVCQNEGFWSDQEPQCVGKSRLCVDISNT